MSQLSLLDLYHRKNRFTPNSYGVFLIREIEVNVSDNCEDKLQVHRAENHYQVGIL